MVHSKRVVVTGVGIICALGKNRYEVITDMKQNKTGIEKMTRFSTESFISQMGAEVKDYEKISLFSKEEQENYDLSAQYGIVAVKEALEDSGMYAAADEELRIGLAFGTCNGGINSLEQYGRLDNINPENYRSYPFFQQADHIAQYFKFKGPVSTINTACAASGNAIGYAYDLIKDGYSEVMVAGGADTMSLSVYAGFNTLQALNNQPCSPYNNKYGLSLGEGAAFIVMETLESAEKRGSKIYAEICGYGLSNDAYHETAPDPKGRGISWAVQMALENANVKKEHIGYINTHGTGTPANDPAELYGLRQLFGEDLFSEIPLSSSKAYFGHNLGAAASIEYVTTLLAMQEGLLPATLHFEKAREGCEDMNLIANEMRAITPKYFLCNNSAFGGHNCSIVSRNWNFQSGAEEESFADQEQRVVIAGMGMVSSSEYISGTLLERMEKSFVSSERTFSLKEYNRKLYTRRMNALTQFSIGAIDLALKDANAEICEENQYDFGLCYGTSRGSLQSAMKYLETVFNKGPEFASGIYFPDMVLNSTAGKVSKILGIKGYASSLSSGGNDGLLSILNGYQVVKNGIQTYCLAAAGDERSKLADAIDQAYGLDKSSYSSSEGSAALLLTNYDHAFNTEMKMYAEITGVGLSFNGDGEKEGFQQQLLYAVDQALMRSNLGTEELDFIFYNSAGCNFSDVETVIQQFSKEREIPVYCFNDRFGYAESFSSLSHLYLAADIIYHSQFHDAANEAAAAIEDINGIFKKKSLKQGMVISSSINGNNIAVVLSSVN
ncbi:beta-ketoacyl synthase N-terminal-like domain-containing protein [Metabacillus fastidiosus]|uniref:beta-ketoacyl synthase N-terminal-like domain-containing protein n=1 Tax=Metabacillus fastidiosus TaxID=1458 RepID=UPI003D2DBD40